MYMSSKEDIEGLKKLYYSKKVGLTSFDKLWRKVKKEGLGLTQKEVKAWLAKQQSVQVTKEFKKPKQFTTIRAPEAGSNLQMDLMFFSPPIKGKTGVLQVIDVHSRRAFSELINNKREATVKEAFMKILNEIEKDGKKVRHVNSDEGVEFVSVWKLLRERGAQTHISRKEEFAKNAIVERFNRTIRNFMRKYEAEYPRTGLVDDWQDLVEGYNESYHRTIKAEPMDVWTGDAKNKQDYKDIKYDFEVGDQVRTLYKKELFEKGTYGWDKQLYAITKILRDGDFNTLEQKHFVSPILASGDLGAEKSDWFMGYEFQKITGVERNPNFDEEKLKKSVAQVEKQKQQMKQKKQLAKEGLDDAAPILKKKPKKFANPQQLVGKRIAVKWASKGGKNFMLTVGKKGPSEFYSGVVKSYDGGTKRYKVAFDDDKKTNYTVNLNDPTSTDYIPPANWKKI